MATTRTEIGADEELMLLKALVAEQQERLDALEGRQDSVKSSDEDKRSTRRQLLKLAGATLAGAAGSAALRAIPASAADGNFVTVGTVFTETLGAATGIDARGLGQANSSGAITSYVQTGLSVWGYSGVGGEGVHGNAFSAGIGVVGYSNGAGAGGIGVKGAGYAYGGFFNSRATGGPGVFGSSYNSTAAGVRGIGSPGVLGTSTNGIGVQASTTAASTRAVYGSTTGAGSTGVQGQASTGYGGIFKGTGGLVARGSAFNGVFSYSIGAGFAGVVAAGFSGGPDAVLAGTGRLSQYWFGYGGTYGGPNFTPSTTYFEMIRNLDGSMWISRGTGVGRAAWKRVNAVRVDSADGTGAPFAPFRVFDTRSGAKKLAGSTTIVPIAGKGTGVSTIPADAVAVIGNLTATQYTGTGFLAISPAGVSVGTSTVNFITGQAAIANSFIVGLGTGVTNGGKLQVKVAGHATHFLVDITGYLQ